jgi:hypothetical protein
MEGKGSELNIDDDDDGDDDDDDDDDDEDDDEDEDADEDTEGDEDEADDDDRDEDDEYYDLDICPEECSLEVYFKMIMEREKRLDIEDIISAERKSQAIMSKDLEYQLRRSKVVEVQVNVAEAELLAFQVCVDKQMTRKHLANSFLLLSSARIVSGPETLSRMFSHKQW